jgi:hypothetical protein
MPTQIWIALQISDSDYLPVLWVYNTNYVQVLWYWNTTQRMLEKKKTE